jgi:hypothetical protein
MLRHDNVCQRIIPDQQGPLKYWKGYDYGNGDHCPTGQGPFSKKKKKQSHLWHGGPKQEHHEPQSHKRVWFAWKEGGFYVPASPENSILCSCNIASHDLCQGTKLMKKKGSTRVLEPMLFVFIWIKIWSVSSCAIYYQRWTADI